MTLRTNARIAGVAFLVYIAVGIGRSILLVVALPLRIAGIVPGSITPYLWIPMAVFEVVLAIWLIIKGIAAPARRPVAAIP